MIGAPPNSTSYYLLNKNFFIEIFLKQIVLPINIGGRDNPNHYNETLGRQLKNLVY